MFLMMMAIHEFRLKMPMTPAITQSSSSSNSSSSSGSSSRV
jgi:hypothetical protein